MSDNPKVTRKRSVKVAIILLVIAILLLYWPVQTFNFVDFDDLAYVVDNKVINKGLSLGSFFAVFTDISTSNWHPLTMLSHMLDWQLFGKKAGGHHWTSVIIHILNTILLFLFLHIITGAVWRSAFVAAIFAVHPINIESVAWIAERKNVLSTFFWMMTILFYVWYVKYPNWKRYLLVMINFILGLMSKPMLVTLPFVLLLLDYWPLQRTNFRQQAEEQTKNTVGKKSIHFLIQEKIPLFVLSALSILITVYAAKSADTVINLNNFPMMKRIANAFVSYSLYIKKLFLPFDLAVFYPLKFEIVFWQVLISVLLITGLTIFVCRYFHKFPFLGVGWFWYLGTLVPVIGIVQVGAQAMADRYAYIPFIGLFIIIVWTLFETLKKYKIHYIIPVTVTIALMILAHFQLKHWNNTFTLFSHAIAVTEDNYLAHYQVGKELMKIGKHDDALIHFRKASLFDQNNPMPLIGIGNALSKQGKHEEAICAFRQAVKINPYFAFAYDSLCSELMKQKKVDEIIYEYKKAIKFIKNNFAIYNKLGDILILKGCYDDAIIQYREALSIQPSNAEIYFKIGMALVRKKNMNGALEYFHKAVMLNPGYKDALYQKKKILQKQDKNIKSGPHY